MATTGEREETVADETAAAPRTGLAGHNPFYLASALSMLVGYFVLADAVPTAGGALPGLVLMVAALEIYELLLLGLGVTLLVRTRLQRDGTLLVILALLFVADVTFLNMQVFTADPDRGLGVHAAVLALGLAKGVLLFRLLRIRLGPVATLLLAVEYAAVLGVPGLLSRLNADGGFSASTLQGLWWAAGALLVLKGAAERRASGDENDGVPAQVRSALRWVFLGSLIVHLGAASFIFRVPLRPCFLSPIVLGVAAYLVFARPRGVTDASVRWLAHALPLFAVVLSLPPQAALESEAAGMLTPLRLAFWGSALVFLGAYGGFRLRQFLLLSAAAFLLGVVGTSLESLEHEFGKLLPETQAHWGLLLVLAAFLTLGAGAAKSLRKAGSDEPKEEVAPEEEARPKRAGPIVRPAFVAAAAGAFAVLLIAFAVAIPGFHNGPCRPGGHANESAAIATLRNLHSAQSQFQAAGWVDRNGDGTGEFGTFEELSAAIAPRGREEPIDPPVLSGAFRTPDRDGVIPRSGYRFLILLPESPHLAETVFCAYAWPADGHAGYRSFFLTAGRDVLSTTDPRYVGPRAPKPGAALRDGGIDEFLGEPATGVEGQDGNVWTLVR